MSDGRRTHQIGRMREDNFRFVSIGHEIGTGSFARVREGIIRTGNDLLYQVVLKMARVGADDMSLTHRDVYRSPTDAIQWECAVYDFLHSHCARYGLCARPMRALWVGFLSAPDGHKVCTAVFPRAVCDGLQWLTTRRQRDVSFRKVFNDLAQSIHSYHHAGIAHLDVSLENVLWMPDGTFVIADAGLSQSAVPRASYVSTVASGNEYERKLCDAARCADLARSIGQEKTWFQHMRIAYKGKQPYQPPEDGDSGLVDPFAWDMWMLGVCFFTIVWKRYPFTRAEQYEAFRSGGLKSIVAGDDTVGYDDIRSVIETCLQWDPANRCTSKELLEHPFFHVDQAIIK